MKNLTTYEEHLNEGKTPKASDFKTGDKIFYTHNKKRVKGTVVDHFGDGVMIDLDRSIYLPTDSGAANPMGYNTDRGLSSFELYDGEDDMGVSIENLSKR